MPVAMAAKAIMRIVFGRLAKSCVPRARNTPARSGLRLPCLGESCRPRLSLSTNSVRISISIPSMIFFMMSSMVGPEPRVRSIPCAHRLPVALESFVTFNQHGYAYANAEPGASELSDGFLKCATS